MGGPGSGPRHFTKRHRANMSKAQKRRNALVRRALKWYLRHQPESKATEK